MRFLKGFILLLPVIFISCTGNKTAVIWTDHPEFAIYTEYFNATQNQYRISIRYYESPVEELKKTNFPPDIIVGSWLKNASTGANFRSLDNLFGAKKLSRNTFYQKLLAVGRIDRKQYLLPVSFNVPALIFSKEREQTLSNSFTIDFDEIKELSREFNAINRGAYTRMGFSPLWSDNFLLIVASLFGVSFREAQPLTWDTAALEKAMAFVYDWTHEINTNNQMEEDFTFKYFFDPQDKLVLNGRILFSYMESRDLFTLSEDRKGNIGFRWLMEKDKVPINEDMVLIGIPKRARSAKAAKAFIQWFFTVENQRELMEYCKANRISENVFGICGGFSALNPVTEQVFPRFYPELLGSMPPSEYIISPNVLPANWAEIKERVVLPYLQDRAKSENSSDVYPLERRLTDWIRLNR